MAKWIYLTFDDHIDDCVAQLQKAQASWRTS
jgi:hypothetical protein